MVIEHRHGVLEYDVQADALTYDATRLVVLGIDDTATPPRARVAGAGSPDDRPRFVAGHPA
jgi:hypothetical protein